MNAAPPTDHFAALAALGYGDRLIPITPPNCPLSERSSLYTRLTQGRDDRGKAPGVMNRNGQWHSFGWLEHITDPERDFARWRRINAGVGIRCGRGLVGIDADTLDKDLALAIREEVLALAPAQDIPMRIGRAPKALYLFRTNEEIGSRQLLFGPGGAERVELIVAGKQFVAHGLHPAGTPYRWPVPLTTYPDLPEVSASALAAFFERIQPKLPLAQKIHSAAATHSEIDQETLKGDPALVANAVSATPNDNERFASREAWLHYGYAIKAAVGDDLGLTLFQNFSARWTGGENDPEIVEADWRRMKPPFRRGASWLFDLAREATGQRFDAAAHFETEPEKIEIPESLLDTIEMIDAADLLRIEPRPQRWIVRDLIPAQQVTMLSGDGGTGKSLIVLQLATAMATRRAWLGEVTESGSVLFVTAEDDLEEINRRLHQIKKAESLAIPAAAIDISSLWGRDAVIAAGNAKNGLLDKTPMFGKIEKAIAKKRPTLTVLDTQADLFGGDEIKRIHARQFIGMLQGWCRQYDTAILLLAHPSVAGMQSNAGTSGNTAWSNSVRSRLYLKRIIDEKSKDEADPDIRVLTNKKANRSRVGAEIVLRYSEGRFMTDTNAKAFRNSEKDHADDEAFIFMLRLFKSQHRRATLRPNSPDYAPKNFAAHPSADINTVRFESAMHRLLVEGRISNTPPDRKGQSQLVENLTEAFF